MSEEIANLKFKKKFFKRKAKILQDEIDILNIENNKLREENERLKIENSEIILLRAENRDLDNKFMNMFLENSKLVETFDLINQIMTSAIKK